MYTVFMSQIINSTKTLKKTMVLVSGELMNSYYSKVFVRWPLNCNYVSVHFSEAGHMGGDAC